MAQLARLRCMETPSASIPSTRHFEERRVTRGLRGDVHRFILAYGQEFHAAGARHLTVVESRLPRQVRGSVLADHARDWIIVLSDEGVELTCYRRPRATRFLKAKPKRRLSPRQLASRKGVPHHLGSMLA